MLRRTSATPDVEIARAARQSPPSADPRPSPSCARRQRHRRHTPPRACDRIARSHRAAMCCRSPHRRSGGLRGPLRQERDVVMVEIRKEPLQRLPCTGLAKRIAISGGRQRKTIGNRDALGGERRIELAQRRVLAAHKGHVFQPGDRRTTQHGFVLTSDPRSVTCRCAGGRGIRVDLDQPGPRDAARGARFRAMAHRAGRGQWT